MNSALEFIKREWVRGDVVVLKYWRTTFYRWNGSYYEAIDDQGINTQIWHFLKSALAPTKVGNNLQNLPFKPENSHVSNFVNALKARTNINSKVDAPSWACVGVWANPKELIPFKNGLYHLPTNTLYGCNPHFFNTSATDIDYKDAAPEPVKCVKFLRSLWPADQESIDTLQEIFGLLISSDTSFQKIFGIVGPARSGKGTILRVLAMLVGPANYTATTMKQLGGDFGTEGLIGKGVCCIPDAMLSGHTDV